ACTPRNQSCIELLVQGRWGEYPCRHLSSKCTGAPSGAALAVCGESPTIPGPKLFSRERVGETVAQPAPLSFSAADGYVLRGRCWRHEAPGSSRPVVLVNPATSVRGRYYARF